ANKIPGIRAGLCHDGYSAHQGVEHDDVNVLVMGARVIGVELAKDLCTIFLKARFTGEERHRRRLAKTLSIEQRYAPEAVERKQLNTTVPPHGQEGKRTPPPQNPLLLLQKAGQSVWLDYIRRNLLTSGELKRLIDQDGLRGMTSNPSIFEKAIAGSTDYADILAQLTAQNLRATEIFERIAIRDVQDSADLLRPVYA